MLLLQLLCNFFLFFNFEIKLKVLHQKTVKELSLLFKLTSKKDINKCQENKNGAVHFPKEKIN